MRLSTKKIASLIGIIGTGSGLTIYSVMDDVEVIPSFTFSQSKLIANLEEFKDSNQLNLDSPNSVELNLSPPQTNEHNTLTVKEGNQPDFKDQTLLNKGLSLSKIGDAFNDMKKVEDVRRLGIESSKAIEKARASLSKEEAQILKKVVQKYRNYNSSTKPRRRRRGAEGVIPTIREKPSLSELERRSLSKHYDQFVYLSEFKNSFESELDSLSGEEKDADERREIKKEQDKLKEGTSSLREVRWDYPELKLFGGQYGDQRRDTLDPQRVRSWRNIECQDVHCGWANWKDNPYRNFFKDEEEWKRFISNIVKPQKKILENVDNPKKIACSLLFFPGVENFVSYYGLLWFMRKAYIWKNGPKFKRFKDNHCGFKDQGELFKDIDKAKRELQFKIGSELLKRMDLLDSSH